MLMPDLCSRTYTVEVLKVKRDVNLIVDTISRLTVDHRPPEEVGGPGGSQAAIFHSFVASARGYHRSTRRSAAPTGEAVTFPRTKKVRGKEHFLYDVLLARCGASVIIAVPYHALAETFFVEVDRALAGTRAVYEKLDITKLVIRLGRGGVAPVVVDGAQRKVAIGLTRCQLAYSDPQGRSRNLQHVSMSGGQIGASEVYAYLTGPVLKPESSSVIVTPVVVGFSLFVDGVKKTSATTDRHGNFKVWIGPGATRIERVFSLLDGVESIEGIVSTTSNLPILQSGAIRGVSEG